MNSSQLINRSPWMPMAGCALERTKTKPTLNQNPSRSFFTRAPNAARSFRPRGGLLTIQQGIHISLPVLKANQCTCTCTFFPSCCRTLWNWDPQPYRPNLLVKSHFRIFHIYLPTGVTGSGYAPRYGVVADRGAWSTSARLKVAHRTARPSQKCTKFCSA